MLFRDEMSKRISRAFAVTERKENRTLREKGVRYKTPLTVHQQSPRQFAVGFAVYCKSKQKCYEFGLSLAQPCALRAVALTGYKNRQKNGLGLQDRFFYCICTRYEEFVLCGIVCVY